jgi:hypothetical protein
MLTLCNLLQIPFPHVIGCHRKHVRYQIANRIDNRTHLMKFGVPFLCRAVLQPHRYFQVNETSAHVASAVVV